MPAISVFYGIAIFMYFGDHPPAHFHAVYGEHIARVGLGGVVLEGRLPPRAQALVRLRARQHPEELQACWERVNRHEPPGTIDPLP